MDTIYGTMLVAATATHTGSILFHHLFVGCLLVIWLVAIVYDLI